MKKLFIFLVITSFTLTVNSQWIQTNGPFGGQNVLSLVVKGTNIFAGTTNGGVFITNDNGNLWTQVNNGLANTKIKCLAVNNNDILAGTWQGAYVSSNDGSTWTLMGNGLSNISVVNSIVVKDTNIYAGLYTQFSPDGVYVSGNNGNSWLPVNNGLPYDSFPGGYYIMGLGVCGNNIFTQPRMHGIYISQDDGGSWSGINNGFQNDANGVSFASKGNEIFIGNTFGIFYSNNNGTLWTNYTSGLPMTGDVHTLLINGNDIFAGTNSGPYISTNNGQSWTNISTNGIANQTVTCFAVYGGYLFAGTASSGVWQRPLSEITGIEDLSGANNSIKVFPNPAMDIITIESTLPIKDANIMVYNVQGQLIWQQPAKQPTVSIDISGLAKGLYFIKLNTGEGSVVRKFIRE